MSGTQSGWTSLLPYLVMGAVVVGNVLGNVFLKLGSSVEAGKGSMFGVFGWHTPVGIGFFAAAVVCYAWALKRLPLHLATSILALQYIGAIAAAAILFGEAITDLKWAGIVLICIGLAIIAS